MIEEQREEGRTKGTEGEPRRRGMERGYRWVEWDKVALGVFFPSGWDLMDCV